MATRFDARAGRGLVWLSATVCLAVIGLVAAVVFVNWATLLIVFLIVAGVVGSMHLNVALGVEPLTRKLLVEVLRWSGRAGVAALAICGFAASIGLGTLPLVILVAATFPLALTRSEPAPDRTEPPATEQAWPSLPLEPEDLTDRELCLAWRRSFLTVSNSRDAESRQAVAEKRRRYLDELERRNPDAFAEWLQSMPRAAGDPGRYYVRTADMHGPDGD